MPLFQPEAPAWPDDFPRADIHTNLPRLKAHPAYAKAKAGDDEAAVQVLLAVTKPALLASVAKQHPNAIVVPVLAEEASGRNKLPLYLGIALAEHGLELDVEIAQANRVFHTGASAAARLKVAPKFDGPIQKGREYILVDDVTTSGSSLAALRNYIESKSGNVVRLMILATTAHPQLGFGGDVALKPDTKAALRKKFNAAKLNQLLKEYEIANSLETLSNSQGRYILTFRDVDSLRTRIAEAGNAGVGGKGARALAQGDRQDELNFQPDAALASAESLGGFRILTSPSGNFRVYSPDGALIGVFASQEKARRLVQRKQQRSENQVLSFAE